MMFGNKKEREERQKREKERLARKLLGRDSGRKTWGLKCSPDIPADLKKTADALNVKEYAVGEHCLELGLIQVQRATKDPEQREELWRHLTEDHVGRRTIEKVARYDREASEMLEAESLRRFEIDRAVRQLVVKYTRWFKPDQLDRLIDLGYRTQLAIAAGWQPPPNVAQSGCRPRRGSSAEPKPDIENPQRETEAEGAASNTQSLRTSSIVDH